MHKEWDYVQNNELSLKAWVGQWKLGHDYIWEMCHLNRTGILLNRKNEGMNAPYFAYGFAIEDFLILNII